MNAQGYIIIFGSLLLFIIGAILGNSVVRLLSGAGIVAWLFFAFFILRAMNTDI